MKVVFLDIDGVLNALGASYAGLEHPLDGAAIARLNRIAGATGAAGVLSTSWRLLFPWPGCRDILVEHGVTMPLVGETPDLWTDEEPEEARRREIAQWLAENRVERHVVLDDLPLYPDDHPHFVRTVETVGLTDADVARVLALLR